MHQSEIVSAQLMQQALSLFRTKPGMPDTRLRQGLIDSPALGDNVFLFWYDILLNIVPICP